MLSKLLFACLLGACAAFVPTTKLPGSRVARAAVSAPPQMGIGGVNGALDRLLGPFRRRVRGC